MTWLFLTVGKPALAYARVGRDDYAARIARYAKVEHVAVKASAPPAEGAALLARSEGCLRIVLDSRGRALRSRDLAALVGGWRDEGRQPALLVGGADGHDASMLARADFIWSLGPLTLQHELAFVVALEQIYRAHTILAGHPYHRE